MLRVSRLLDVARSGRPLGFTRPESGPFVVVWNVCRHCNLRCPHCYIAAGARPSPRDLDTAGGRRLLESIAAGGVSAVVFSGGEPLLREDLEELVAHASSLGLSAHLSTSGVLLDPRRAGSLRAAGCSYAGVSIDGPPAFHDANRGLAGAFDRALAGLEAARESGMRTGLRMTLTRASAGWIAWVADVARTARADRFYVSHLVYAGRGLALLPDVLDRPGTRRALDGLFELAGEWLAERVSTEVVTGAGEWDGAYLVHWLRGSRGEADARRVEEALRARGGNTAGEAVLSIDPDGRVHPDPFWRTASVGDLTRETLAEVLAHPKLADLRRREDLLRGRCRDCRWLDLCRGGHRARAEAATGDPWGDDPACPLSSSEIAPVPEGVVR